MKRKLSVTLTPQNRRRLRVLALLEGELVQSVMERALEEYIQMMDEEAMRIRLWREHVPYKAITLNQRTPPGAPPIAAPAAGDPELPRVPGRSLAIDAVGECEDGNEAMT